MNAFPRHIALLLLPLALCWCPPAGAAEPIRIGVLTDLSSFGANVTGTGSITAAKLAIEDFGGEIDGRPIVILSADTQNKPDIAAGIAREWFDADHVDVIVDVPQSAVALSVQDIARSRQKMLLVTSAVTQDLTGKACSPYTVHWADDTYALATGTAREVAASGKKTWFFVTADFAFGTVMQAALVRVLKEYDVTVLGTVRPPTNTEDFSAFLLTAQASRAQVVALVNVGSDLVTAIKQAHEFGLVAGGQQLVAPIVYLSDVQSLGLAVAQGLLVTTGFYWDDSNASRAFAERYQRLQLSMPNQTHAGTYAALRSYLSGVAATKSTDAATVVHAMKSTPTEFLGKPATIREDGRVIYDLGLYEVKAPADSKGAWDDYRRLRVIPGDKAFMPLHEGHCSFIVQP
jgi:branched-chain amino acid transport system substrate-binding protein